MKLLSRYVLKEFTSAMGVSLGGFVIVFLVIDLVDRLSSFIDRGAGVMTMITFYGYYVPYIALLVMPMAVLLASLFCMGGLIRNRELLAMKAAGMSLYQIVLPLQGIALIVSLLGVVMADRVIPWANRQRAEIEYPKSPALGPKSLRSQVVLRDVDGQVFAVQIYEPLAQKGRGVLVDRFDGGLVERTRAEEAIWEDGRWVFHSGDRRVAGPNGKTYWAFNSLPMTQLTLTPEDFSQASRPEDQMTFVELRAFIDRKERNGARALRESVALHMRLAFPFANFVIGLLGLPMASRMRRTGRPLQVGVCLLTCFAFYGCIQLGRAMGWNDVIAPVWGAWGADVLFSLVGVLMLVKMRK